MYLTANFLFACTLLKPLRAFGLDFCNIMFALHQYRYHLTMTSIHFFLVRLFFEILKLIFI